MSLHWTWKDKVGFREGGGDRRRPVEKSVQEMRMRTASLEAGERAEGGGPRWRGVTEEEVCGLRKGFPGGSP